VSGRSAVLLNSIAGLAVRGIEVAAKLGLYVVAAALLGVTGSGLLFIAMTWGHLAATLSRLGIERALTRLVAGDLAVGQGRSARRQILGGLAVVAATSTALGLATHLAAPIVADVLFHDPALAAPLAASGLVIPVMALTFTLTAILSGLERTSAAQIFQNVFWPIGMLLGLALGARDPETVILALATTMFVAMILATLWILRDRAKLVSNQPLPAGIELLPSLPATAAPLYVVELVQVSIASLPALILGVVADAAAVSIFSLAQRASMLVHVVLLSLGTVAAPRFAAFHRTKDVSALARLNRQMQLAGTVMGGGVCLVLAAGGGPLLSLIGTSFAAGAVLLAIMAAGQFVSALYTAQDILLAMTGNGSALRVLNLLQLGTMLALSIPLITTFGAEGAAIITALAVAQGGIGTAVAARLFIPEAATFLAPALPAAFQSLFRRSAP
jgi:O-antigen/teichoic acid export membrane protein